MNTFQVTGTKEPYTLSIGGKPYQFKLSLRAGMELEKKYGEDAVKVLDGIANRTDLSTNLFRVLSCACLEEISLDKLENELEDTTENIRVLDEIVCSLIGISK